MEADSTLLIQEDKKWHRPWTSDEIRKNSGNWTLAGDVGLYNLLTEFSQNIISRTHEVENAVDSLVHRTKMASAKVNNIINDFHMLSNLQFVENRVYDEEIQETTPETKPTEKTKEQREAEMLPKIIKAVELGLQVLDQAFTRINVNEISDSEDEDLSSEGRTILEPKDPFESRLLPFIIGSEEFNNSDYAGLQDLLEEVDVSAEIESSDSEETSSEDELPYHEDKQPRPERVSESDSFSSSEESELFGSEKDEKIVNSIPPFDVDVKEEGVLKQGEESQSVGRESRQSSVSSNKAKVRLPQVLPVTRMPETRKESDDLFANDDEASDDDSPFRKKTGLFSSDLKFDEEKDMFDGGLFGEKPKETKKVAESPKKVLPTKTPTAMAVQKTKEEPSLFGNDEDSEDDIFSTLAKTKTPTVTKETKSYKKLGTPLPGLVSSKPSSDSIFEDNEHSSSNEKIVRQDSSDKTDSLSTPSSPVSTKTGNGFGFATGGAASDFLFGDESDADDLFSSKKSQKRFDFDASHDDDDLFGLTSDTKSKKSEVIETKKSETEKQPSLFAKAEETDKPYKKLGTPLPGLVPSKAGGDSIFEDSSHNISTEKSLKKIGQPLPGLVKKKAKDSIFDDSDSSEQEDKFAAPTVKQPPAPKKKDVSIFDDDADNDIFSQAPKKRLSPGASPSVTKSSTQSQSKDKAPSSVKTEKNKEKALSLFSDDDDDLKQETKSKPTALPTKNLSLFEDSGDFDLFSSKAEVKKPKVETSLKTQITTNEDSLFKTSDHVDGAISSKAPSTTFESPVKEDTAKASAQLEDSLNSLAKSHPTSSKETIDEAFNSSFDVPPDTSNMLNVINKGRAKISAKRRKPTKKGRLSTLEGSESSSDAVSAAHKTGQPPDDDVFSASKTESPPASRSPVVTHKAQEKKKMDLMSQLMSEAAGTRIGKRPVVQVDEDEEDIDIFAEVSNKDRSRSRGFSFKSPIETVPVVEESKRDEKEVASVLDTEDAEDDFFTEPSFKNFRSSISHKDSILNMDDDDDDDLFSTIKTTTPPKAKLDSDPDIFGDDSDIFADLQKEKYEMFPNNVYDDEDDDDIFSNIEQPTGDKGSAFSSKASNSVPVKKEIEKKPVFDDPLSGLLGED